MTSPTAASISIHAPVKGATLRFATQGAGPCISIHAPVKGATATAGPACQATEISIHAPVKGATAEQQTSKLAERVFQSTLP